MRKLVIAVLYSVLITSVAMGFQGAQITQPPTINAGDLTTGTLPAARIGAASITPAKLTEGMECRIVLQNPTTSDNTRMCGPWSTALTIDNVVASVDNTSGRRTGAATDNVTFNINVCPDNTSVACTGAFTSNQTVTGAAEFSSSTINNPTVAAGSYLMVSFSATNAAGKSVYIRVRSH